MKQLLLLLLLSLLVFVNTTNSFAFEEKFINENKIFDPNIKTVVFYKSGKINTFPIIDINNLQETLTLSFDDLGGGYKELMYSFVHCTSNWEKSNLFVDDYLQGNRYGYIENYEFSTNTYQDFTNYWVVIPSENMKITLSGNYLLKVYFAEDEDSVLLTRRFYVVNQKIKIQADLKEPTYAKYQDTKQEIDFTIDFTNLNVMNTVKDINVVLRQNKRWDNQITDLKPMYINNNKLIYDYEEENLFWGNSEWRFVDMRSIRYPGRGVNKLKFDSLYHVYLLVDEDRSHLTYAEWMDLNGDRIIAGDEKGLKPNEIDYVFAHFKLTTPYPDDGKDVYLFGDLTDWEINEDFKLHYDASRKIYFTQVKVKQGYYNYFYVIKDNETSTIDCTRFQGSHFETENDYRIFVYARSQFFNTDELIGYVVLNTKEE